MKNINNYDYLEDVDQLCEKVRSLIIEGAYDSCKEVICNGMAHFPNDPHPHNLMGILLEKKGKHAMAMKHFRAAYALDPTYIPAKKNMETYGTFHSHGTSVYSEKDLHHTRTEGIKNFYDKHGFGHGVSKKPSWQ